MSSINHIISVSRLLLCLLVFLTVSGAVLAQYPQNNFMQNQPNQNYLANSTVFKQEIARLEINVVRSGQTPLPITQVPRLEEGDTVKVRLLDEPINGLKPDQSNYDWTFLIAFVNPGRNDDATKTVSEEVNFKKKGWYKEHTFVVPFDSQPIFFLYPKPQYRSKILKLISKSQNDIQKIGEKTIEIADAYGKIGMFLNELQDVVNRNYYRGLYSGMNSYNRNYGYNGSYGSYSGNSFGNNSSFLTEQAIERIARSFNIQLPGCWGGANQYGSQGNYNPYNNNNGYYNNNNNNGYYNPYNQYGTGGSDLMGRIQCVARSVRIEDFDISISRMLQQGGIMVAAQLAQKYPQLSFWINIAAVALDFIVKLTNRAPLKIVPTLVSSNEAQTVHAPANGGANSKVSLFAEMQPSDNGFVTAYPLVFHKWQANADANLIELPMPVLMDSCLHAGQNVIRTTDVINDWMTDNFTKDFQLTVSSANGFQKNFALKKNVGFGGWEFNLSKEELATIPKNNLSLEAKIKGKRGFNKIESSVFPVQVASNENWAVEPNSQKAFTVGGKRVVILKNQTGNCRCLEAVIYKTAVGGEFVFDAKKLEFSPDGKEVSFEIDTTTFASGAGTLELRQYGGEMVNLNLNLFPLIPQITEVKVAKGDMQATLIGERLEQIPAIRINGKRAVLKANSSAEAVPTGAIRERTYVFENTSQWQDSNNIALELELVGERTVRYPTVFAVSSARPVIVVNQAKEIEGFAINNDPKNKLPNAFQTLPIFPIETAEIGVNIQNALTDFDFKMENLRIETRIENTLVSPIQPTEIEFEVLDWRSIRLYIRLNEQTKKMLGGRRIQFRISDGKRGNSDWYSISQTFVRLPQISAVNCVHKQCEIIGKGISYIQQISLDDGKTWFPQEPTGLVSKAIENGLESASIPSLSVGKRQIKIKLRDFPNIEISMAGK